MPTRSDSSVSGAPRAGSCSGVVRSDLKLGQAPEAGLVDAFASMAVQCAGRMWIAHTRSVTSRVASM
jgi:hypothetical protein